VTRPELTRAQHLPEVLREMAEPPHFAAPEDNEAETPEEAAAVAEAWREHKDGKCRIGKRAASGPQEHQTC
jgi:hypothetical protein